MRIVADTGACEGFGMCEAMADDYFEIGPDDVVVVHDDHPPAADREHVHAAVQACPARALRLDDN
ncbi:ferredoxin [Pseudonocardia sp. C8]|uniref:ferredoxin n=1 Tax=Pseudonocardia sp. C8 TaxID=2762759 RepID=UPI0016433573|nr:ferredoxin [Pseudonocardia sp. C8]MBC3191196.1 ferredoxin [Pseudonocardia sp. C8]